MQEPGDHDAAEWLVDLLSDGRLWVDLRGTWLVPRLTRHGDKYVLVVDDDDLDESD